MSIVTYRNGVLAADTQATCGGSLKFTRGFRKIRRLADGGLIGAVGPADWCAWFLDWRERPSVGAGNLETGWRTPPENFAGIEITARGAVFEWGVLGRLPAMDLPYDAWGSGADLAIGAMHAGGDACAAVRAAIAHCAYCGGDVTFLTLSPGDIRELKPPTLAHGGLTHGGLALVTGDAADDLDVAVRDDLAATIARIAAGVPGIGEAG